MVFSTRWSRTFLQQPSRMCRRRLPRRPHLEVLEDRTLLAAAVLFDPWTGQLAIHEPPGGHTAREAVTANEFVEVVVDGHAHSSDPASAWFDPALTGAGRTTLAGIRFEGSGDDTLILGSQVLDRSLTVRATGAVVAAGDVIVAGRLEIAAPTITVRGALRASAVALASSGWITIDATGRIEAGPSGGRAAGVSPLSLNTIEVAAAVFVNSGQLHADGLTGGQVFVCADKVLDAGGMTATGALGDGGTVWVEFREACVETAAAVTAADGGQAGHGGNLTVTGGATGRLFSSGRHESTGAAGGGAIALLGREVVLAGAAVDASGQAGGGAVRIGGDFQGRNPAVTNARTVDVAAATTVRADALGSGPGGRVIIWADAQTTFAGAVSARGGPAGGAGGFIEVSGAENLDYGGTANTSAPAGRAGTLLLDPKNLVVDTVAGAFPQFNFVDPHPTAGGHFGQSVAVLSNGNVVVTNPNDNFGGSNAGAAYFYNGLTGALVSALVGSSANDQVGSDGITALSNGNYVVDSTHWNGNRGAATWGSGTAGVSGAVSAANSLTGSSANDFVGNRRITALSNGNYVVDSPNWASGYGAATWGSGTTGVTGIVSGFNSLIGSSAYDSVGFSGVFALSNGNYVVASPSWSATRGAATWGSGTTGVSGAVSAANSLIGSNSVDYVGSQGVAALTNGNYVVASQSWNGGRGAVTWGNGAVGVSGAVSAANSLIGSNANDFVGYGLYPLSNGNYVVDSPLWNSNVGAATWGNGTAGITGTVSVFNSLVGGSFGDQVSSGGITALSNGNYVVDSRNWNVGRGAATWGSGTAGVTGTVTTVNSLTGSLPADGVGAGGITVLSNGNYVVDSPNWNGSRGAATWGSGTAGVTGFVSAANSLIGSLANDLVGANGIVALSNGNYVVASPLWNSGRGAATWENGAAGVSATVSAANSLIGSNINDTAGIRIAALNNGNYVAASYHWSGDRGAATWGSGTGCQPPLEQRPRGGDLGQWHRRGDHWHHLRHQQPPRPGHQYRSQRGARRRAGSGIRGRL